MSLPGKKEWKWFGTWSTQAPLSCSLPWRGRRAKGVSPHQHPHRRQAAQTEVPRLLQAPQTPPRARCPPGSPPPTAPCPPPCSRSHSYWWCEERLWSRTAFWTTASSSCCCRVQTGDDRKLSYEKEAWSESEFVASWIEARHACHALHTQLEPSSPFISCCYSQNTKWRKFWSMEEQLFLQWLDSLRLAQGLVKMWHAIA